MDIRDVLMNMDALDDEQWTADGAPKIAAVASALGKVVLRQEIVDAAPGFTRTNMVIEGYDDTDDPGDVKVAGPSPIDDMSELRAEKAELEHDMAQMVKGLEEAKKLKDKWIKRLDAINDELLVLDPPMTNAQRARNYIIASNEARLKRHGVAALVIANLPKSAFTVGTPLDNAFARKNKRGLARPTR